MAEHEEIEGWVVRAEASGLAAYSKASATA